MTITPQSGRGQQSNNTTDLSPPPSTRNLRNSSPDHRADPRAKYLDAIANWERADREYHRASIAVACGDASAVDFQAAAAKERKALAVAILAGGNVANVVVDLIRLAVEDDTARHAMLLLLLKALCPALEPVANRLADLEQRVTNLEILAAGGEA